MKKLIELRKEKGLTQPDMAKYIGVSDRQFRRYENNDSAVPLWVAVRWAKKLGLSIGQFTKLYI